MTWERYAANTTGFEIVAYKGGNFQPRGYCDDPLGGVYTTKAPATIFSMSPIVQLVNTNIAWDLSESVSESGTIGTFDIDWGGTTDVGDLSSQDWSMDPTSGNVQYTTVGTYTATATTTDTLGNVSQPATLTIIIVEYFTLSRLYIATATKALYTLDPGGSPTQRKGSLSLGNLIFLQGRLNPHYAHLPTGRRHYWACTEDGLVYTADDGTSWTIISAATLGNPTNTAADGSPPVSGNLYQVCVFFDPKSPRRVYCLRATNITWNGSNDPRVYLYWSDNYGVSWSSGGVGDV